MMTKHVKPSLVLGEIFNIAFNKLVLSQANVRRVKTGVSLEELAQDIAHRSLLQSLSVRPQIGEDGKETGFYEVPAGGRRFRALEILVKQKRLAKDALIPCIIRPVDSDIAAEEDSLAENVQRAPLHPLDQFRAFQALRELGLCEETIAARFYVSVQVVRQRLKLASVAPKLLDLYADEALTLEQVMAFSLSQDHARQEQVWDDLNRNHNLSNYAIKRNLTEGTVRGSDKRVKFIGIEAYEQAGGVILRDLFDTSVEDGWLQNPALIGHLVAEKLETERQILLSQGWKWVDVAKDFPYGHLIGMKTIDGHKLALTEYEQARLDSLQSDYDALMKDHEGVDELPEAIDQQLGLLETKIEALTNRLEVYDLEDMSRAGVFLSIDYHGKLSIEAGYIKPEDEEDEGGDDNSETSSADNQGADGNEPQSSDEFSDIEPDDDHKPLSEKLLGELSAYRTIGLINLLGQSPDIAYLILVHALCLKVFYRGLSLTCLEIDLRSVSFTSYGSGVRDFKAMSEVEVRHKDWRDMLPSKASELWDAIQSMPEGECAQLLAHCVSLSVNALRDQNNSSSSSRSTPSTVSAPAEHLAGLLSIDMVDQGWKPTQDAYLGRVSKAQILEAVSEATGPDAAGRLAHLKKTDMAQTAEALMKGSGWLPQALRTQSYQRDDTRPDMRAGDDTASDDEMSQDDQSENDDGHTRQNVAAE